MYLARFPLLVFVILRFSAAIESGVSSATCPCTISKTYVSTSKYTIFTTYAENLYFDNYTATERSTTETVTSTITTNPLRSVYEYYTNTRFIDTKVPFPTTISSCHDFTVPSGYPIPGYHCKCKKTSTSRTTLTQYHERYRSTTIFTATVTLDGTKVPTKVSTVTEEGDLIWNVYQVGVTTTYATTHYNYTATRTLPPVNTPSAFKLVIADGGQGVGVGPNYTSYLTEKKWSDYPLPSHECLSWQSDESTASIFHFSSDNITLNMGSGACLDSSNHYIACPEDTTETGPTLKCFVDCLGLLHCYSGEDQTWSAFVWYGPGGPQDCIGLTNPLAFGYDPGSKLDITLVPV